MTIIKGSSASDDITVPDQGPFEVDTGAGNDTIIVKRDAGQLDFGYAPKVAPVVFITPSIVGSLIEGGEVKIELTLSAPSQFATFVQFTATSGDKLLLSLNAFIRSGETSGRLTLTLSEDATVGDLTLETRMSFTSTLEGAQVNPLTRIGRYTIADNDANGLSVSFPSAAASYKALSQLDAVRPQDQAALDDAFRYWQSSRHLIQSLEALVLPTTSVALASYQFFTGKSPSAVGLAYLVNSPDNASDLNDANGIYAGMNVENRYINFAANLGLVGEGNTAFASAYKDLSFRQAVEKAYEVVIGTAAAKAAGIDVKAAIDGVIAASAYFDALASQRMASFDHDLAMKAGVVGYLMVEGLKARVGQYARAIENFYLDLADGSAQHNVNLVAVYGPGTFPDAM